VFAGSFTAVAAQRVAGAELDVEEVAEIVSEPR
jgi:hypothetical protein